MKRSVIWFALFMIGAILMCVSGRRISLSWLESLFVVGAIIVTAATIYLSGGITWLEEEQQSS